MGLLQIKTGYDSSGVGHCAVSITTTAGSDLIAVVGAYNSSTVTFTTPGGGSTWQAAILSQMTHISSNVGLTILYYPNAAAIASSLTFNASGDSQSMFASIAEYSNGTILNSSPLDKTASSNGFNTSNPATGTTATTTQANELIVAGLCSANDTSWGTPTNGFNIEATDPGTGADAYAYLDLTVSSTGAYTTSASNAGGTALWAGVIATFKAGGGAAAYQPVPHKQTAWSQPSYFEILKELTQRPKRRRHRKWSLGLA